MCGQFVAESTSVCPACGTRFHWGLIRIFAVAGAIVVGVAVLFFGVVGQLSSLAEHRSASSASSRSGRGEAPRSAGTSERQEPSAPAVERAFIDKVGSYVSRYEAAPNELQKSAIRVKRAHALAKLVTDMQVKDWVGTLKRMRTSSDGSASVAIELEGTAITVHTDLGNPFDPASNTLIVPGSPLYKRLASMAEGDEVVFSGSFLPGERDYLGETSLTEAGAMTEPEFVMRFSEVTSALDASPSPAPTPSRAPSADRADAALSKAPPGSASPAATVASSPSQIAAAPVPEAERAFIAIVEYYLARYTAAPNELQKTAIRVERRVGLTRAFTDLHVSGWVGTLKKLQTFSDGQASVSIQLEGSATSVHTDLGNPFDRSSNTSVEHGSALYNKLASLSVGERVVFSGNFLPGEQDRLKETSFTEAGSMTQQSSSCAFPT